MMSRYVTLPPLPQRPIPCRQSAARTLLVFLQSVRHIEHRHMICARIVEGGSNRAPVTVVLVFHWHCALEGISNIGYSLKMDYCAEDINHLCVV